MAKAKADATATAEESGKTQVQSVDMPDVSEDGQVAASGQFDILLDMDVAVTVALGETNIPVRRLLQLGPGAVVELDKSVDAPADLYLKGTKFAEGEIVVVDNRFGIRIQRIIGLENEAAAPDA
ncbi:FliM/FliN family flagellar motor switch protein [Planctomycetota bacterium]